MDAIIEGIIVSGIKRASDILKWQKPILIQHFPEIASIKEGTINVELGAPILVLNPHFTTPPIAWPDPPGGFEGFSFLRIGFECPIGGSPNKAWIYIPHRSPHRYKLAHAEIIAEDIKEVGPKVHCRVHIRDVAGFIV